ncbi:hypothetical protein KIN20_026196 [Parelaphostrongylus tenuis]|uniref:Uncharacterized protein n=1 Tax=Parelaphostrongylus tenuis TaxID=148309 RepID=A0AAD5MWC8_PARTN|nr:hypothetical protein KIN20_026196 [Parelaphostrongylus tenuis]
MMVVFLLVLLPTYAAGSCKLPPAPEGTRWNQTTPASDDSEISLVCKDRSKVLLGGESIYCDSGEWRMKKLGYCEDISNIGKVVQLLEDDQIVVRYDNLNVVAATKKQLKVTGFMAQQAVYKMKGYKGPVAKDDAVYELKEDWLYKDGTPVRQCHGNTLMVLDDYTVDLSLPKKYPRKGFRYFPIIVEGILYVDGLAVARKVESPRTKRLEGTFTIGDGKIYRKGKVVG